MPARAQTMESDPGSAGGLHLFQAHGVEIEYMLVDGRTLDVLPVADRVLQTAGGGDIIDDVEWDGMVWSNELVLHVIELKTREPGRTLAGQARTFQRGVAEIRRLLAPMGGTLMPGAAHPWMDPHRETRLWPHEDSAVYETFNRIFDCRGHGWSNIQAIHLNLPFSGDDEFVRLHSAIRLVLPILPGLSASSPYLDGAATGLLDSRMEAYRKNCARIPSVTGRIIPEAVGSIEEYRRRILGKIYEDLAPHDPGGIVRHEWANARGAIARFERNTIEIRVIDTQECPAADVAVLDLTTRVIRALVEERWSRAEDQARWPEEPLYDLLLEAVRSAEEARIPDGDYLRCFGMKGVRNGPTIGDLWRHLADEVLEEGEESRPAIDVILSEGPLARRLLGTAGARPSRAELAATYRRLCECLAEGRSFTATR